MATQVVNFSSNPDFRFESSVNVIGWETDPDFGEVALVQFIEGARRMSGTATPTGTGTISRTRDQSSGEVLDVSFNFTNVDYVELHRGVWRVPTSISTTVRWDVSAQLATLGNASVTFLNFPIPKRSTATQPSFTPAVFTAGTPISIAWTASNSAYRHDILYSFGNIRDVQIAGNQPASSSGYPHTPSVTLIDQIPNAPSGPYTITLVTKNGETEVGRASFTGTLLVPNTDSPTVNSYDVSDTNIAVANQVGTFVQGLSVLRLDSITATPVSGATIVERRLEIETAQLRVLDTRALLKPGTIPVVARAIDSRGLTGTLSGNINVLAYNSPYMFGSPRRANSSGAAQDDGAYLSIPLDAYVKSLVNSTQRNQMTLRIMTRPMDGDSWTVRNTATPATTPVGTGDIVQLNYNATVLIGGGAIYDPNTSYAVRVELSDRFNTVSVDHTVATAYVAIDLNGSNVGVGKLHERGRVDVGGAGHFEGVFNTPPMMPDANLAVYGGDYVLASDSLNIPAGTTSSTFWMDVQRLPHPVFPATLYIVKQKLKGELEAYIRFGVIDSSTDTGSFDPWQVDTTSGYATGTSTQRAAITQVSNGARFYETDTNLEWLYRNGAWFLAPGQVLASMVGPASNTTGTNGTQVGTTIATPALPIGQRVKIMATFSQYNSGTGLSAVDTSWRNHADNVTFSLKTGTVTSRAYSPSGGAVVGGRGAGFIFTTTVAAKVSAAIYLGGANTSGVYGADGTNLWIESA